MSPNIRSEQDQQLQAFLQVADYIGRLSHLTSKLQYILIAEIILN